MPRQTPLDLDQLRAWCKCLAKYIAAHVPGQSDWPDFVESTISKLGDSRGDVRALRLLADSLRDWISVAPVELQLEVDGILLAQVGYGLLDEKKRAAKITASILKRGHIVSDDEFRFLAGMLDHLDERTADRAKMRRMVLLMDAYEKDKK